MKKKSCIYEGRVSHHRHAPLPHSFALPIFMMFIDLAELPSLFSKNALWSAGRPNLAWFRREDYLAPGDISIDEAVRDLIFTRTGRRPEGPVRILTHLRYFGHCFNPVSFYYCYDSDGEQVKAILAEINNTPWNERHVYLLEENAGMKINGMMAYTFDKEFHVSPFMDMDSRYDWRFNIPGETLEVQMQCSRSDRPFFDVTLSLARVEIDGSSLSRVLMRYPFMTVKVLSTIYWQAFRLWRKGVPFYVHPKKRKPRRREHERTDKDIFNR